MSHAAGRLEADGVGKGCASIEEAWQEACDFSASETAIAEHRRNVEKIKVDGHKTAARLLLSWAD